MEQSTAQDLTIRQVVIAWQLIRMENLISLRTRVIGLRDENGKLTKAFKHVCWDGCMFPNDVMLKQQTWNDILATMIKVRQQHGWYEA